MPHDVHSPARHTLVPLKTPSQQVAMVLSALAEGLDASAAERVFGYSQATITTWLTRAGEHAQILHKHSHLATFSSRTFSWTNCEPDCAVPNTSVFLWLAIDPCTKIVPVLHLGPRTHSIAHLLIHSVRQMLAAFLPVIA